MRGILLAIVFISALLAGCWCYPTDVGDEEGHFTKEQASHARVKRTILSKTKILGAVGAIKGNILKLVLLKLGLKAGAAGLSAVGKIGKVGLGLAAGVAAAKALGHIVNSKHATLQTETEITSNTWSDTR